jgi:hypothetical protein
MPDAKEHTSRTSNEAWILYELTPKVFDILFEIYLAIGVNFHLISP